MGFLSSLNVSVVLGSRLSWNSIQEDVRDEKGQRILKTVTGEEYRADTVVGSPRYTSPWTLLTIEQFLCTGNKGNVDILSRGLGESCVNPENGLVRVLRTLQVDTFQAKPIQEGVDHDQSPEKLPFPHIFAIGDSADAFDAIKAGHTAYYQGEVAARNIASLIRGETVPLAHYTPGAPAIKVSVGLVSTDV